MCMLVIVLMTNNQGRDFNAFTTVSYSRIPNRSEARVCVCVFAISAVGLGAWYSIALFQPICACTHRLCVCVCLCCQCREVRVWYSCVQFGLCAMYVSIDWFLVLSVFLCFLPCLFFSLVETLSVCVCVCVRVFMCICVWVFSSTSHQRASWWCQRQCPGEDASAGPANNAGFRNLTTGTFVTACLLLLTLVQPCSACPGVPWPYPGRDTCSQELARERTRPCLPQQDATFVSSVVLSIWGYVLFITIS